MTVYEKPSVNVNQLYEEAATPLGEIELPACFVAPLYLIVEDSEIHAEGDIPATVAAGVYDYPEIPAGGLVDTIDYHTSPTDFPVSDLPVGIVVNDMRIKMLTGGDGSASGTTFTSAGGGFEDVIEAGDKVYVASKSKTTTVVEVEDDKTLVVRDDFGSGTLSFQIYREIDEYEVPAADIKYPDESTGTFEVTADGIEWSSRPQYTYDDSIYYDILYGQITVTYRALDPSKASTYAEYETTDELEADIGVGQITIENPYAYGVYINLLQTDNAVNAIGLDINYPTDELLSFTNARDFLEFTDAYSIAYYSTMASVHQLFSAHCTAMSTAAKGKWRIVFFNSRLVTQKTLSEGNDDVEIDIGNGIVDYSGKTFTMDGDGTFLDDGVTSGDELTVITETTEIETVLTVDTVSSNKVLTFTESGSGTIDIESYIVKRDKTRSEEAEDIALLAQSYANRRAFMVWPDKVKMPINNVERSISGVYGCAALTGMCLEYPPHQGFTNLPLTGFTGLINGRDRYTDARLNTIAGGGVLILDQTVENAALTVRHQLSTDRSSIYYQELSITKAADYVSKLIVSTFAPFLGKYNITEDLLGMFRTVGQKIVTYLVENTYPRIGGVLRSGVLSRIEESETNITGVEIDGNFVFPKPLNNLYFNLYIS